MKEKTCCFTGHRKITDNTVEITSSLKTELIKLIENGYTYFGTGGALGFDFLAAETVLELRKTYPYIKLILVLPCHTQTKYWVKNDIERYEKIKKQADKVKYISQNYYNGCMQERNRHLVNHSSVCICYKRKNYGGTAYTVDYAEKSGLEIIRI